MSASTPAAFISRCSSSPSRERSPMPQKMLTPAWRPIMLWIISVSSTVLPTPAPPNSPDLPPRSSGVSTSMILMPVSNTCDCAARRLNGGGAWCTERHCTSTGGKPPSIGWPNTSNMRDSTARPTGACKGRPVLRTTMPRARPCVGVSAMPLTWCASRCACTSMAMRSPSPQRNTVCSMGSGVSKRISTTLPRTETTRP